MMGKPQSINKMEVERKSVSLELANTMAVPSEKIGACVSVV